MDCKPSQSGHKIEVVDEDKLCATGRELSGVLTALAQGKYPPSDGMIDVLPRAAGAVAAILAFTGHHIVAADVPAAWVESFCPPGDLLAPVGPVFLGALTKRLGRRPGPFDVVLTAPGVAGDPQIPLRPENGDAVHPRAQRALRVRTDVQIYATAGGDGLVTVGRGLAGRWEAGFEVAPESRNRGLGRALAATARRLIPADESLFLQVAVGNIASLRAVLAAGFSPVCSEVLFFLLPHP